MFESLSDKLQNVFQRLRGSGPLTEADVTEALREVRLGLLEADVNFKVVKDFIGRIRDRAVGTDVLEGLHPGQQVIKIVDEELTALLGGEQAPLTFAAKAPTVLMLCGLQGAGKTTHAGKLSLLLRKQGRHPLLVAADIYRPAAIKQLQIVGEQVKTPVFTLDGADPEEIARQGVAQAIRDGNDVVILDTAGRLQIDLALMDELKRIKAAVNPHEILLVVDAMTGQEAVNVAQGFNEALDVSGFILTKLDGDTRGGAALSIKSVAGRPIKFVGVGEKMEALEVFHPDRMASRILGMGDVLTLIERAEGALDQKKAAELEKRLRANKFDFEDYLEQMRQMRKMGPLGDILKMIPGLGGSALKDINIDEGHLARIEGMILSMTPGERRNPALINGSRRRRIAGGSGRTIQEVNGLLTQFEQMKKMMRGLAGADPGSLPSLPGMTTRRGGSNKTPSSKNKRKPPPTFKLPFGRR